ncbi:hypothetical protein FOL47_010033 [Perkinsus chesapeaki]|uniref:Uncharacterized protein n=1 Tax=Perkinsus chesapeaki TaxID=330153 RepID=A0A7J6L562_PERCH|nr:hypothetical protein FOL47_010033 [Perkinsus chesapeaki]
MSSGVRNLVQPVNSNLSFTQDLCDSPKVIETSSKKFIKGLDALFADNAAVKSLDNLVTQTLYLYNFTFEVARMVDIIKNIQQYGLKVKDQKDPDVIQLQRSPTRKALVKFFSAKLKAQLWQRLSTKNTIQATSNASDDNPFEFSFASSNITEENGDGEDKVDSDADSSVNCDDDMNDDTSAFKKRLSLEHENVNDNTDTDNDDHDDNLDEHKDDAEEESPTFPAKSRKRKSRRKTLKLLQ